MCRALTSGVFVFLVLGIALTLSAGTSGKVSGVVVDGDTGEPLVAVNVTLEGTSMGAITNPEGRYHIVNVPPGDYTVKAAMMGFETLVKDRAQVNADFTTSVDFELNTAVLDVVSEIVVTAERPLIRKDKTSSLSIIEHDEIEMLPIESPFEIVGFQAGATNDRRGIHIRGGRENEVAYTINGASILDPIFSQAAASYDEASIQEMMILTGGYNPEYGNAQSAIVNVVSKEGGSEFEGEFGSAFYLPLEGLWESADDADKYNTGYATATLSLSGPSPWTQDLRYFLSVESSTWDDWDPHVRVLENQGRERDQAIWKLTAFPHSGMKFYFEGLYYDTQFSVWSAQRQKVPETFLGYDRWSLVGVLGMSHMVGQDSYYDLSVSRFETNYHVAQPGKWWDMNRSQEWNTTPADEGGGGINLETEYDENNFIIGGDNNLFHDSESTVNSLRGSYTWQATEHHQFKMGGEYTKYRTRHHEIYASPGNVYKNEYLVRPTYIVSYAQDKIEYSGLVVNAGLRLDLFDPEFKVPSDPAYPWDPAVMVPGPECGGPDQTEPPLWNLTDASAKGRISPRLGISHPVSDVSVLHFTYGHYFQVPPYGYLYTNTKYDMGGHWPLIGNPDLQPEKTVAYEVGIESMIAEDLVLDVTGFYKDIDNLVSTVTINDTRDPETPPDATQYTTYLNTDYGNVRGFELTLRKRFREAWMGRVIYTFMIGKGRSSDVLEGYNQLFDGTVAPTREYYLDWDRRHSLVLDLGYGRMDNWAVNVLVKYATGSPYTPVENTRSLQPEQNTARFPDISLVNLKISKDFSLFAKKEQVFLEVYNLFNKLNLTSFNDENTDLMRHLRLYGEWTGPYDDVTVYGNPREIRAGFRLMF
jgi:outer membrane receptor protein involved in Fe transport